LHSLRRIPHNASPRFHTCPKEHWPSAAAIDFDLPARSSDQPICPGSTRWNDLTAQHRLGSEKQLRCSSLRRATCPLLLSTPADFWGSAHPNTSAARHSKTTYSQTLLNYRLDPFRFHSCLARIELSAQHLPSVGEQGRRPTEADCWDVRLGRDPRLVNPLFTFADSAGRPLTYLSPVLAARQFNCLEATTVHSAT
jgi:hypothetical protein